MSGSFSSFSIGARSDYHQDNVTIECKRIMSLGLKSNPMPTQDLHQHLDLDMRQSEVKINYNSMKNKAITFTTRSPKRCKFE